MQSLNCIQTGVHTVALLVPYSATWRVPGVQRHGDGILSVRGRFFHMQTIKVNCGKYKRTFWKLTIHAARPHQLLSAKSLLRRIRSVLATIHAPAYIVDAILTGGIKFSRVDLANDYRQEGTIQPDAEDRKEYNIKRMTDEREYKKSLYIQTEKRSVVECRYDKRKELLEVHKIHVTKPISRIERRFFGARSCTRHGVRTLPALVHYLHHMRRRLRTDQSAYDRGRLPLVAQGEARGRAFISQRIVIPPHPPRAPIQPRRSPSPRHPAEGAGGVRRANHYCHARGPPSPPKSRAENLIAKPRATVSRCCCAL